MSEWHSLFIREARDTVEEVLLACLTSSGYTSYNPFGMMPSKPYKTSVKLFVAPPQSDWTRVIGEVPSELCPQISISHPLLRLSLRGSEATTNAYAAGEPIDLADWLRMNNLRVDLARLNAAPPLKIVDHKPMIIGLDALPKDVQKMAKGIDSKQAAKLFERMSSTLMQKVGGDARAAQALLQQGDAPDWNSAGGGHIQQLAAALGLGDDWREPDFVTLRDAYQAAARKQRRPGAPPLPGDAEALAAVPYALAYKPVFAGKDD